MISTAQGVTRPEDVNTHQYVDLELLAVGSIQVSWTALLGTKFYGYLLCYWK